MCPVTYCLAVAQRSCLCGPTHGSCSCGPASNRPVRPSGTDACIYCHIAAVHVEDLDRKASLSSSSESASFILPASHQLKELGEVNVSVAVVAAAVYDHVLGLGL